MVVKVSIDKRIGVWCSHFDLTSDLNFKVDIIYVGRLRETLKRSSPILFIDHKLIHFAICYHWYHHSTSAIKLWSLSRSTNPLGQLHII